MGRWDMHGRNNVLECHAKACLVCEDYLAENLLDDLRLPQLTALTLTAEVREVPDIDQVFA
jgi:hypothetical protein